MLTRRLTQILCGLVAALATVATSGAPVHSATTGIERLGTWDVKTPVGGEDNRASLDLILDTPRRWAFQVILIGREVVIRRWNLDTRKVDLQKFIPPEVMQAGPVSHGGGSTTWLHAYDPDAGVLYLPFLEGTTASFGGVAAIDGKTLTTTNVIAKSFGNIDPNRVADPSCPPGSTSAACLPQQPTASATLAGMSFVPSILSGGQAKVLLFMQEFKPPGVEKNYNTAYVLQWDLKTGGQDFIYRVQSCSNHNLPVSGYFPVGIFQARLTAGIYLGCQASGGTGQVVRIDLDLNGKPSAEAAFPGPQGIVDVIADEEADRMLLRISNTEGISWWVFDGSSRSYTGVIGVTNNPVESAAGVDPSSGRLYSLAPKNGPEGQETGGGLMYSDIRRSPAPQMLATEEYEAPGAGRIAVDVHPITGVRTVYARLAETTTYQIYRDNDLPVDEDPFGDQDALTIDVDEKPGETGRTYNGSGHAYGARVLFAGGLNGVPPTGPDTNEFRIGRTATLMLGTPCGVEGREVVLGAVKNAALSNNLSNASAAVGEADAGSKQDLNEPTGRCYPRPTDNSGFDLWDQVVRTPRDAVSDPEQKKALDYPRPFDTELDDEPNAEEGRSDFDELSGSGWPFASAECTADGGAKSQTHLHPLDRGDSETGPIDEENRRTSIPIDGYKAEVACRQSAARVEAYAQMLLHEEKAPALETPLGDLGMLRVGEVSSRVSIYLDKLRGLVTRAESTARDISIGDHVFIDEATAIGEAWAKGRPGTAATSFFRRLCGVRIKDEAPDQTVNRPVAEYDPNDPTTVPTVEPSGGPEVQKRVDLQPCGDVGQQATQSANLDPEKPMIDAINRALGFRGRVSAPKPDGPLSQGSPGGYLASIQKDRLETISSRAVNNDASTQVPALELLIYNDDPTKGRGRQVYQFAGVDASVTYGIYLLNPGGSAPCFCPPPDDGGLFQPPPPDLGQGPTTVGEAPLPRGEGPVTMLFKGIGLLFRSPKDAAIAAAIWALLYSPVQMAGRRRALRSLA